MPLKSSKKIELSPKTNENSAISSKQTFQFSFSSNLSPIEELAKFTLNIIHGFFSDKKIVVKDIVNSLFSASIKDAKLKPSGNISDEDRLKLIDLAVEFMIFCSADPLNVDHIKGKYQKELEEIKREKEFANYEKEITAKFREVLEKYRILDVKQLLFALQDKAILGEELELESEKISEDLLDIIKEANKKFYLRKHNILKQFKEGLDK